MSTRSVETPRRGVRIRWPDRSTTVLALVVVLGTAALLWAADGLARIGAQSLIARAVQQQTGAEQPPVVRVHGALFLPQVVRGRYTDVQVDLDSVGSGPLRLSDVHADLRDVRLPFHDVLVRDVHRVRIAHATEQVTLSWDDLNRYLRLTGRPVTAAPAAAPGEVRLTGSIRVLGRDVSAATDATLTADTDGIAVRPTQVDTAVPGLDRATRLLLAQRFTVLIPMQALPFGQQVTGIVVRPDGVHVSASGYRIVVAD